jgi:hypothetical protein
MLGQDVQLVWRQGRQEGVVATTAVKGNRKATMNDLTGRSSICRKRKCDLDLKKKTYEVTTFEQIRQRGARRAKGREAGRTATGRERGKAGKGSAAKEYEIDFNVKETGQKKQLAGYDTHEVIMTVTVREKGKSARRRRRTSS